MSQLLHSRYTKLWMDWFRDDLNFESELVDHCCQDMRDALTNVCKEHASDSFSCPDMVMSFSPMFREYGLIVHDGAQSISVRFCPWCGLKLPVSLRDTWFDRMDALGIDDPFEENAPVPDKFKSAAWWREEN